MRTIPLDIDRTVLADELMQSTHRLMVVCLLQRRAPSLAELRRPLLARLLAAPCEQVFILPLLPGSLRERFAELGMRLKVRAHALSLSLPVHGMAPIDALRLVQPLG